MQKLDMNEIQQFLEEAKKEYEAIKKSEGKGEEAESKKEEIKEELKKEEEKPSEDAPKAEDATPDASVEQVKPEAAEAEGKMNEVSVDELVPAYMQMEDGDLMANLVAIVQAFAAKMQMVQAAEAEEPVMDKGMMEKKATQAINLLKSLNKSNKKVEPKVSEKESELTKEVKNLKNQIDTLAKSVEKLTTKATSHALNGTNFLAKSEPAVPEVKYTYADLKEKLAKKARQPDLSPEDRKKITRYTLNLELNDELKQFLDLK